MLRADAARSQAGVALDLPASQIPFEIDSAQEPPNPGAAPQTSNCVYVIGLARH